MILYAKTIKLVIFFLTVHKINSLFNYFEAGVQDGKIGFRKSKHQAYSMISKQESKGFADIIIDNDGDFHILARNKAITLSALKINSHNIEYPIHSMTIQPGSYGVIKKLSSIIGSAPVEDINDLFQSAKYPLLSKRSAIFFV